MILINSFNEETKVINSRTSKKASIVWRRRQGLQSGTTVTTYERLSLADNKPITLPNRATETFNLGKLILSIAASFTHSQRSAQYESLWLAQTVEDALSANNQVAITPHLIAETTHMTLKRYDELAAVQYAAKHHLITSVRRRGRPSISENA